MDPDKLKIIEYDEIPLPEEEEKLESAEDDSSSSSEEEVENIEERPDLPLDDSEITDKIRAERIDMILDGIVAPRRIERDGKLYVLRLSRQPMPIYDLISLSRRFEEYLKECQAQMEGYCPIRRELYDLLFDELIRQTTICCPERGSLLMRVRDEFRMTVMEYEKLLESLKFMHTQLKETVTRKEKSIDDLMSKIDADQNLSLHKINEEELQSEEDQGVSVKSEQEIGGANVDASLETPNIDEKQQGRKLFSTLD